jgi:hypothetical protein
MAHLLFCSRFLCPMAEDESYEMIKADSEIFIGEDDTK